MLVAITGGIGAGKSTVAAELTARGGALVDADALARQIVDPDTSTGKDVLSRIAALLGDDVLRADGGLDRQAVAARVFGDEPLRQRYNAILRPALLSSTVDELAAARSTGAPFVIHEIPLLSRRTPPVPWTYDLIVTVEAAVEERIRRLQDIRGHTREEAAARIAAQGDEIDRLAIADLVIRTDPGASSPSQAADTVMAAIASRASADLP